eukprot:g6400.t1
MALLARKATPAKRKAGLPSPITLTLFVLLAGRSLLQGAWAQTCEEQDLACVESELCSECTFGFLPGTECSEHTFDEGEDTCPHGVSYCCAAEAAESGLEACLNDPVTQEYLECNLDALGCSVFDMPCIESLTHFCLPPTLFPARAPCPRTITIATVPLNAPKASGETSSGGSAVGEAEMRTSSTDDPPTTATDELTSAAPRLRGACSVGAAATAAATSTAVALAVSFLGL